MKNKFINKKVKLDGLTFASKKEARFYLYFKGLERDGKISHLQTQVRFDFPINGEILRYADSNRPLTYYADFTYIENEILVVVDVKCAVFKGKLTEAQKKRRAALIRPEYKIKKALMKSVHGISVVEV
ncbi:MAG: DUF1064 domain-containing protein [Bdellovibrio sp.]